MIRTLFFVTLCSFFLFQLQAQTPQRIIYNKALFGQNPAQVQEVEKSLMCNEAGTIFFGNFIGESNDFDPDTIYFCFGDQIDIIHNGDQDLSGDPNPATDPGIGYAIYDCPPSVEGPSLQDLVDEVGDGNNPTDPCIANDAFNTLPPDEIYVSAGFDVSGNQTFVNTGDVQAFFANGDPVLLWFAPITYDALGTNPPTAIFEDATGGLPGPCVDVNIEEAFAVVYLNEITVSNINTSTNASGCGGSFVVEGGLPEFDGGAYDIQISLTTDPTVTVALSQTPNHGEEIVFSVPQPGVYDIAITDDKNCSTNFTMDMSACAAVNFSVPTVSGSPGTQVCLGVSVENFTSLQTLQLSMNWDPTVLEFVSAQNIDMDLTGITFNEDQVDGEVSIVWFDASFAGVTIPDGSEIFQICFNIIGNLGDASPVTFSNTPTAIEFFDVNGESIGFQGNDGSVIVSDQLTLVLVQDVIGCFGQSGNALTVQAVGGTAPYSFTYSQIPGGPDQGPEVIANEGGTFTITDLPAGMYEIVLEDDDTPAMVVTQTIEIEDGPFTGVNLILDRPECFGGSDGSLTAEVDVNGVVVPNPEDNFTFTWSITPNIDAPTISNLSAGQYLVTVTDDAGCEWLASTSLSQPAELMLDETITDASCSGASNGAITVAATGGTNVATGEYTFQWEDMGDVMATTSTISNLMPGDYDLVVLDDNGCTATATYTVGAIKTLSINQFITDASCNGDCDGAINITGTTTGAPADEPYIFTWSAFTNPPVNNPTTSENSGLCAGTYTVTMVDSDPAGCMVIETYIVEEPEVLEVALVEASNETCVIGMDGSATIGITGGTFPYQYDWSHDPNLMDSIATGLAAGNYMVDIVDLNNCATSIEIDILAPTPPSIVSLEDDMLDCSDDNDGTLTVVATPGGAEIGGYAWSNGGVGETIVGLTSGTYIVTITAQDGCVAIDSAMVLAPAPLTLDDVVPVSPTCPGDGNGTVTVFASGGTEPYTYALQDGADVTEQAFNLFPGLSAGTYVVSVTDANGCPAVVSTVAVEDPPSILIDFSSIVDASCFEGICDGQAIATASYSDGTAGNFNFIWESGEVNINQGSSTAALLCPGFQNVTVTDAAMCFGVDSVDIPSPPPIVVDRTGGIVPVSCNGLADGSISLTVTGGTPDYSFLWLETGEMTSSIENLPAGIYTAVITDANGCSAIPQIIELGQPDPLILSVDPITTADVSCNGEMDGTLGVSWNTNDNINSLGPNPFTWSDNIAPPSEEVATDLPAGTYSVTLTDVKGCMDEISFTLNEPSPITAVIPPPVEPECFGESTFIIIESISGGNGTDLLDYSFMVDNNGLSLPPDQPFAVFAGDHIITIEDPLGCIYEEELTIEQPSPILVELPSIIEVELGDSTTRLNPIISSSLPIDSFVWTPEIYLSDPTIQSPFLLTPIDDTEYSLTVVDANGCSASASILVEIDKNRNVYIPNVFSPNGDGSNDEFRLYTCTGVEQINFVRIYDRWGELIFEGEDLPPDCIGGSVLWDGTFNGKTMNPAVFVYLVEVEFIDGLTLLYRGDLTLLR